MISDNVMHSTRIVNSLTQRMTLWPWILGVSALQLWGIGNHFDNVTYFFSFSSWLEAKILRLNLVFPVQCHLEVTILFRLLVFCLFCFFFFVCLFLLLISFELFHSPAIIASGNILPPQWVFLSWEHLPYVLGLNLQWWSYLRVR